MRLTTMGMIRPCFLMESRQFVERILVKMLARLVGIGADEIDVDLGQVLDVLRQRRSGLFLRKLAAWPYASSVSEKSADSPLPNPLGGVFISSSRKIISRNLFRADETNFREWEGETRTAFPSALVVARRWLRAARDTRSAPLGAAAPPLPKKFFDTFWEPYVRGTPLRMRAAFTPFRKPKYRQIGVRGAKAWFCLRESFYKKYSRKKF